MPPKRRSTGSSAKSTQSTLAFHGSSNKVTKPGAGLRTSKKDVLSSTPSKSLESDLVEADAASGPHEEIAPTTAEAAIIEQTQQELMAQEVKTAPEDEQARAISETKIKQYWNKKEKERKAPRVHQQGLDISEKVLREWDTSGQYGPCIGIARLKRWKRAHKLGLNPPIEVLAVLLKEQEKDNLAAQRAYVDELMSSRFVET